MKNPFRARISSHINSSLRYTTSFLPPGTNVNYHLELANPGASVAQIFQTTDSNIINRLLDRPILSDIKGSGAKNALIYLSGILVLEEETLPFTFTSNTEFHDFAEGDHIRFTWREHAEPLAIEGIKRDNLTNRPDLEIQKFSVTAEFYKSTILTRMTGFGPVVAETLSLEVNQEKLILTITSEGLADDRDLPFGKRDLFTQLDQIIALFFKFSLLTDYQAHQRALI